MTADEAAEAVEHHLEAQDYVIRIVGKDGDADELHGRDAGIVLLPDAGLEESIQDILGSQKIRICLYRSDYEAAGKASCDEGRLYKALKELPMFTEAVPPQDSYIAATEGGHAIVREDEGNSPVLEAVAEKVEAAVERLEHEVVLDKDSDYVQPQIRSDNKELNETMERLSVYEKTVIVYELPGGGKQLVGKDDIMGWIKEDFTLDKEKIQGFVAGIAAKYDTYNTPRRFRTAMGDTVTVGGGWYGWKLDKQKECEKILEDLEKGETVTREPAWERKGFAWDDGDDIGDTYIELDYTNQHMYFYKDGALALESAFVSGNMADGNGSPDGLFSVSYKQSPAVLTGEGYSSDVSYFIVFAYNVGLHDASWRSTFGGQVYKTDGSHGCVNLPLLVAYELYKQAEEGTPVVAYYREPVTITSSAAYQSNAYSTHR